MLLYICLWVVSNVTAQDVFKYHKGSMYSIMLKHESQEYCKEMVDVFEKIPIQDNFYEFNLSKRVFKAGVLEESDTTKANDRSLILICFFEIMQSVVA